jgi:cytochrome c oxidase assembly protein subunit 15
MTNRSKKPITIWLLTGCVLILVMVVIGGITRLTHSGLSMVDWNLVVGAVPPMNEAEWQAAFERYQQYPEFQKLNHYFDLGDFKAIFWWEYIHRLIGRVIGIVFIVPFIIFYFQKRLDRKLVIQCLGLLGLGAFQGFLGWFMVKSGLVDNPHVSHYRLAAHLLTAFLTCSYIFWIILGIARRREHGISANAKIYRLLNWFLGLVIIQIVYGAFVAGLKAGWGYNTFPKMSDDWVPANVFHELSPVWMNFLSGKAGVQFTHRYLAIAVLVFAIYILWRGFKLGEDKKLLRSVKINLVIVVLQFLLGVFTLVFIIPISLAVLHQVGAFFLLLSVISSIHLYRLNR